MDIKSGRAFILKTQQYSEKDLIIYLFSCEHGIFNAIAKGAKSGKSRWGGRFMLFSEIKYEAYFNNSKESLAKLIRVESVKMYDLVLPEKYALASFFAEVFLKLIKNEQINEKAFNLLKDFYKTIEAEIDYKLIPIIFLVKFLYSIGFLPDFSYCSKCQNKFENNSNIYWSKGDSIICEKCNSENFYNLNFLDIKILAYIQRYPIDLALKVDMLNDVHKRLFKIIKNELLSHTKKPLITLSNLESFIYQ